MVRGNWCYRVIAVGSRPPSFLFLASSSTSAASASTATAATTTMMGTAVPAHGVGDGCIRLVVGTWVVAGGTSVVGVGGSTVGVAVEGVGRSCLVGCSWWDCG